MGNNQRKAFTLIELIFIMVVIAIIAIVAIPRLMASRHDAHAATCTQEVQQLISEMSQTYTFKGYRAFSRLPIDEMTNIRIGVLDGDGVSSFQGSLIKNGIRYMCDSENIVEIQGTPVGGEYNLTITDLNPATPPAAVTAAALVRKLHVISTAGGSRTYSLD